MSIDWNLVTPHALRSLNLDDLLADVETEECFNFGEELGKLAREQARWSPEQLASLDFVVQVLMMALHSDSHDEPYGPMFTFGDGRSAIPADFPKDELNKLADWIDALKDPELRARFFDVLWVQGKNFAAARQAVVAYLDSAMRVESPEDWPPCTVRFERALRLAASLGKGALDLRDRVLTAMEDVVKKYRGTDPLYLTGRLTRLLLEFKWGDASQFGQYCSEAAAAAETARDFWRAHDYHLVAADCYRVAGNADAAGACQRKAAEVLAMEADSALTQPGRGAMTAASLLSDAVEAMRRAPGGKERATELHEQLLELQPRAMSDFKSFSTEVDTTELVNQALERVAGKSLRDAVTAFCRLTNAPSLDSLRKQVESQARVAVLGHLMTSEVLNARGRVVAKVPGLTDGVADVKDDGLRWRMFRSAQLARHLSVHALINPTRQTILSEQAPSREDILNLIQYSPWIPPGHGESICRALVAGFRGGHAACRAFGSGPVRGTDQVCARTGWRDNDDL